YALIGGPVTEKRHGNLVCTTHMRRQTPTNSDRDPATHNGISSHVAFGHISDMHRSAPTFTIPGRFTHQLSHRFVQICSFCNTMTMSTMGAGYIIGVP